MAYFRSKQSGEIVGITTGSTGAGTAPSMPNYGLSLISATSGEVYVLQPPVAGVTKTLVFTGTATANGAVVRLSTATGVVSLAGVSTGQTILTLAAGRTTVTAQVVQLMGVNSTSWVITNIYPTTTTPTAATLGGGITASS